MREATTNPPEGELHELLRTADHIAVLTGARVSAESGVPTFRDAQTSLWAKYDPADLAAPEAFARDAELVSRWYDERRCNVGRCRPNAGHIALGTLQSNGTSSVVYPAAGLIDLALRNNARLLEVNPQETPYTRRACWSLRGKSGEVLPQLLDTGFRPR